MTRLSQKHAGAYYTPDQVVGSLVKWAVRSSHERMLDPSCGDGRFIAAHRNSVGIEQDSEAARTAVGRAPWALVHEGDFFAWAFATEERFDCAAGNPPFIRYQTFKGEVRERALRLCASLGAQFSGLASSWAPFLVATASLLTRGGRLAFVVPAEIGHAPYAAPLLEYLVWKFDVVQIVAVREKLFPELSEDCWLLFADGFGGSTDHIRFTVLDRFKPSARPPREYERIAVTEWRDVWKRRLRPYIVPHESRELYQLVATHPQTKRFGDIASIGIGYVSGGNDFFHLRPSEADKLNIPEKFLHPTVRNTRALPSRQITLDTVKEWHSSDDPMLLLRLPKEGSLPTSVKRYLDSSEGREVREGYKCRNRKPWYSVPDVQFPDFFLSYMSGRTPALVRNGANCTCTNSVHSVRLKQKTVLSRLLDLWDSPIVKLSCELEGHPLGGGMLKLEPREATEVVLPPTDLIAQLPGAAIEDAVSTMRTWRHYA